MRLKIYIVVVVVDGKVNVDIVNNDVVEEVDEELPERKTSFHFVCKHFSHKIKTCRLSLTKHF